ncbi:MAG: polysaccharide deacetylase family protein [Candidatus Omnitrophica bacterium]|nr:polysaccharide deacetylase family protein [Candidatus Omnitrophota bacterium]
MLKRFWTTPIMGYHRVGESKADHVPTVSAEVFERQLTFLASRGYRVWPLAELIDALEREAVVPKKSVAITFDDGYEETYTIAMPRLSRFGFPATVFVTPREVGLPGFMTWEQLRAVSRDGMTIGSHTLNHTYLPLESLEQIEHELQESKRLLEARLGRPIEFLSYPVGGFTSAIREAAQRAGYRAACTTNRGLARASRDVMSLRRVKITDRDRHPLILAVKLSGYYDLFRRIESPS